MLGAGIFISLGVVFNSSQAASVNPPATFTATARSSCIVDLAWTAANGSGPSYIVQYTTSTTFFNGGTTIATTSSMGVAHTGLSPATTYSYRVQSVDEGNLSAIKYSTPSSVTTPALPVAPATPASFGATGVNGTIPANDGTQIDLAWTAPALSQYGGFSIDRLIEGGTWKRLGFVLYNVRSYRDGGGSSPLLDNTKIYRYRMSAFESAEGCSTADRNYSASTTEITVPMQPTNLGSAFVYNPDANADKIDLSWTAGRGETYVEIWRKSDTEADFSKLPTIPAVLLAGTNSYSDRAITTNAVYTYEVRGCASSGGLTGCSAFTNETSRRVANAPQNLTASVTFSGSNAAVHLAWENTFAGSGNYLVERAEGSGNFSELPDGTVLAPGGTNPPSSVTYDESLPLGGNYSYRVRADFGGSGANQYSAYSNVAPVSLYIQPVAGWAWSSGLGWVRLSNNSIDSSWGLATSAADSQPYTVYMEKNAPNYLGGYAWSPYGGWLSFNEASGCPSGGSCRAQVGSDGTVTGWAKFVGGTAADGTALGLNRWVSLSKQSGESYDYGLYYTTTTQSGAEVGQLRGFAWGGDVTGWLSFGGPVLKKVTPSSDNQSATVEWNNPMGYKNLELFKSLDDQPNGDKKYFKHINQFLDPSQGSHSIDVQNLGLNTSTSYGFFIRGTPQ